MSTDHLQSLHREAERGSAYVNKADPRSERGVESDCLFLVIGNSDFYVLLYGIKGAAYLKNMEGLVLSFTDNGCNWISGSLQRLPDRITVITDGGQQTSFCLFDHVTVSNE
ncbi:hypothetical protein AB205_0003330 [Aquarana catesbeiana]|uniref:Uncharacterized protein n=1 Tax=Aquarana catesbeiana TaxID=8400 RepID=A0A2G9RV55_AQUCT|nr:hypothetical protein AB205_0003330 [Aquarana catesbeiana]